MRIQLEDFRKVEEIYTSETLRKKKEGTQLLEKKVQNLTEENSRLMKKIASLEEEVDSYHSELIKS